MSNLAAVLEWKYGPVADTADNEIIDWRHPSISQPDQAQLTVDAIEYQKHLVQEAIRQEAERRIAAGTVINGVQFQCDDSSMNRIAAAVRELTDDETIAPVTYMTSSGVAITFNSAAEARFVEKTANLFRSNILESSAVLQQSDPLPDDFDDDAYWT